MKLKRKDIDDVNDDFSDFSLSSPARKIRRLDAELPPIMEEEEAEMPLFQAQCSNQERALVLFKPITTNNILSPSNLTVSVDSDIISNFENSNQFIWSSNFGHMQLTKDEDAKQNKNECLAVVPWFPSQLPSTPGMQVSQTEAPELMEADDLGEATMDIEDNNDVSVGQGHTNEFGGMRAADGLHQWQQQHCMIPHLPQNNSTPVTWFH